MYMKQKLFTINNFFSNVNKWKIYVPELKVIPGRLYTEPNYNLRN